MAVSAGCRYTDSLCGGAVLGSGLYAADYGAEDGGACTCCSDYEPGVGVWGTGRLAGAGRAAVQRGAGRMCPDAGGHADYPGRCYPAQELKWALVFWIYTGFAAGSVDFMF